MAKTKVAKKPAKLSIRSYQVGFGDCFLLSFHYPAADGGAGEDRHVLIDFGSTGKPKAAPTLTQIAKQIEQDCGGKLTAIVATHRHADHINGFATGKGKGAKKKPASGDIIRGLQPKLILQPWTEHPRVAKDAVKLPKALAMGKGLTKPGFVAGLLGMHDVAQAVQSEVRRLRPYLSAAVSSQLEFLGQENLHNLSAVKNLMAMGQNGKAEYLSYGQSTSLEKLLPGVVVHVLGPPTPADYPEISKQRQEDASEFWQLMGVSAAHLGAVALNPFPQARFYPDHQHPAEARWLIGRIRAAHAAQRLSLVRALDDAMNNTSLILLFEIGSKKFLFPGDAQIENWNFALQDAPDAAENRKLLKQTDFYKVGHHGSRNATPKTLWHLFKKRNTKATRGRLRTAVSTMAGKHGSVSAKTEVPRRTLVAALKEESEFFTTQSRKKAVSLEPIEFKL